MFKKLNASQWGGGGHSLCIIHVQQSIIKLFAFITKTGKKCVKKFNIMEL